MDPEQLREFEEQMRSLTELMSQQNSVMAAQMKAQQDYIASMKKATGASNEAAEADEDQAAAAEALTKLEEAEAKAKKQLMEAQENYRNSLRSAQGAVVSFSDALLDTTVGFEKYGKALGGAGDAAWDIGKNFGALGMVIGGVAKGLTMVGQLAFQQADNLLKANDALSKSGAANSFTAEEIRQMGRRVGLSSGEMEKLTKQATTLNGGLRVLGSSSAEGTKAFVDINAELYKSREAFQRLGLDDLQAITGDFARMLEKSNAGLTARQIQEGGLAKQAKAYAENLVVLADLTGKDVEEVKKQQEVNRATYEWTLQQNRWQQQRLALEKSGDPAAKEKLAALDREIAASEKFIDDVGRLGDPAKTAAAQMQLLTGAITPASSKFAVIGHDLDEQIKAVKNGTYETGQFSDAYRKNAQHFMDSSGDALAFSEGLREASGLTRETVGAVTDMNKDLSEGLTQQQIAAKKRKEIKDNEEGKGKAATDPAQIARNELTNAEIAARLAVDDLVASMNPLLKGFDATTIAAGVLAAAAVAASIALAKMSASALMGPKGPAAPSSKPKPAAKTPRARDPKTGRFIKTPPPKPQSWLSRMTKPLSGFASKAGSVARGAGRFVPGIGTALAIGGAAYGAYKGATNAEETLGIKGREATTGEKFASGAGGALSALSFGLLSAETASKGIMNMAERFSKKDEEAKKATSTGLGAQQAQAKEAEAARKKHEETVAAQRKNAEAVGASTLTTMSATETVDKNIEQMDKLRETTEVNSKTEKQALDKFIFNLDQASIGLKSLNDAMIILSQNISSMNFGGGGMSGPGGDIFGPGGGGGSATAPADIGSYMAATAMIESGGDPNARAKTSSAGGMFQFLDSTWKELTREMGKNYSVQDKYDPKKAAEVMAYFTAKQKKQLEKGTGRAATNTDLYMAHFLGSGGAVKFLNAMNRNPNAIAADMDPRAAKANKNIYYDGNRARTLQEVYELMSNKMDKAMVQVAGGKAPAFVQQMAASSRPLAGQTGGVAAVSGRLEDVLKFTSPSGELGDFQGLNPGMQRAVYNAAKEYLSSTGNKLQVNSAKRNPDDQQRLYDETVRAGRPGRGPSGMLVAKPGRSPHEGGNAIDIQQYNDRLAVQILGKYGLHQKYGSKDPVHFELTAADGGIFDGPQKGYEAQLHGTELVAPLLKDSVLMKLAQTPAKVSNIEELFGTMTENMSKDMSLVKSDLGKNTLDPNTMLSDMMKKKTEIEQKVTALSTAKTETIAPATPSMADKALSMNTELMQMLSGKLDTVISVLESGNDVSSKILKSSRV